MNLKFVIVTPRPTGGGAIVLHRLCSLLVSHGCEARLFYIGPDYKKGQSELLYWLRYMSWLLFHDIKKLLLAKVFKSWTFIQNDYFKGYSYNPVPEVKRKYLPIIDDETIVVYPEIVYGNPLRAKRVVRWLLYFYPYKGDTSAYGENDLFFAYREVFNDDELNPECRLCKLQNFDDKLYKRSNYGDRKGSCYIIRKGWNRKDLPVHFDGPIIDDRPEQEIVNIFNKSKYCISYDTQTFYSSIASICGCISIVVPEVGKTRADYTGSDDAAYGVAYGDTIEEIDFAKKTCSKLIDEIDGFKKDNEKNVDFFLQECNRYLKK